MIRKYVPDPAALLTALAGRVDTLETQTRDTRTDVTALGRGLAQLTAQIRDYTATARLIETPTQTSDRDGEPLDAEAVQRDWLTVADPEAAEDWLHELAGWLETVGVHHGLTPIEPCWPLHPDAVALLLALQAERDAAYTGDRPTPVTEWLTRWLPATTTALDTVLSPCTAEHAHRHSGLIYLVRALDPADVARWWTTDRHTPAPAALHLTAH